ncbi:MAG TPA: 6-carboxytetrahydropterin synthase [Candidatus Kapabacteria bacterium]|nr:6-carboxytetrahydropterin synthase [Candidatus Kapabacteria bacterium]
MRTMVAKEYRWEMSHRLPFHKGPCKNIHGHSYKMIVSVEGNLNSNSMVIDYYDLDNIMKPLIDSLDHSFLCDKDDKLMMEFLASNGFKYFTMPYVTTSENIVTFIIDTIKEEFQKYDNLISLSVAVYETIDAFAKRTINLQ